MNRWDCIVGGFLFAFSVCVWSGSKITVPLTGEAAETKFRLGVGLSGGGSRSMSLARGQMAALRKLGVEQKIDALSLVSGGAWFGVLYYISEQTDDQLLGLSGVLPESLCLAGGNNDTSRSGCVDITELSRHNIGLASGRFDRPGGLTLSFVGALVGGDGPLFWSDYLALVYDSWHLGRQLSPEIFTRRRSEMELIINAMITDGREYFPLEISPSSVRVRSGIKGDHTKFVPVSEFGYLKKNGDGEQSLQPLRLQDTLAATSSNYANFLWKPVADLFLPRFPWPGAEKEHGEYKQSYQLIDSGVVDYTGIMPLLSRGMNRIILFVNTDIPISSKRDGSGRYQVGMEKAIPALFGIQPDEELRESHYIPLAESKKRAGFSRLVRNQVFESERFSGLAESLAKRKENGEPTVVLQRDLNVLANGYHGVEGGNRVDVLWVYNDRPEHWWNRLSAEVRRCAMGENSGEFRECHQTAARFPHYEALGDLYLGPVQTNLLFHMSSWMLEEVDRQEELLQKMVAPLRLSE